MAYALAKYLLTRDHVLPGNVHPWATPTKIWPTLMLLAMGIVTLFLNIIVLGAYCCRNGEAKADKMDDVSGYIGYVMTAGQVVAWAVTVGLFKMANTGTDLWGWSCGTESDAIQGDVQSFLNFGQLCTVQVSLVNEPIRCFNYI